MSTLAVEAAKSTVIQPAQFVHITEKGAALISSGETSIQCTEVTNQGLTNRRHALQIQGVFSDAIRPCVMIGVFAGDGRLYVAHVNVDVILGNDALPADFAATKVFVAFDPKRVAGVVLRQVIGFARSLGVPDDRIYVFDVISNQACGFAINGTVCRLNTNVELDRMTCAPTAATQHYVLCGIRMLQFDERRAYNNRDHSSRLFDMQFQIDHFVQHRSHAFDIKAIVAPARDTGSDFVIHQASSELALTTRAAEVNRIIASRSFAAGAVVRTTALVALIFIALRALGFTPWPWAKTIEIGLAMGLVVGLVTRSWKYATIMAKEMARISR